MSSPPIEPPEGQDETPDLSAVLAVVLRLLNDTTRHLTDPHPDPSDRVELVLRLSAVRSVLRRMRRNMDLP